MPLSVTQLVSDANNRTCMYVNGFDLTSLSGLVPPYNVGRAPMLKMPWFGACTNPIQSNTRTRPGCIAARSLYPLALLPPALLCQAFARVLNQSLSLSSCWSSAKTPPATSASSAIPPGPTFPMPLHAVTSFVKSKPFVSTADRGAISSMIPTVDVSTI